MVSKQSECHKSLRVLVFGATDILMRPIIRTIKELLPKNSKLITVGNKQDIGLTCLVRMEKRRGKFRKLIEQDSYFYDNFDCTSKISLGDSENLMKGLDHLQRKSASFAWRHHKLSNISESRHYYFITVNILTRYIESEKINFILFFEIPHLFADTLTYHIAKSLNIETLILSPSIFPNRFYSVRAMENYGKFPTDFDRKSITPFQIDSREKVEWMYMKDVLQTRGQLGELKIRDILMLMANLIAIQPIKLLKLNNLFRTIIRMQRISSALPKWRNPFRSYFDTQHLKYFETIIKFEETQVDLDKRFVYFPLHLQPELTTSSIGGIYSDQILAIEHLAEILPDDFVIYIKENPKQGGQMRGAPFFQRLDRIKNVHWLPSYANTHDLIDKSEFVAVITGTVGWEAICRGKKALIFGKPWYRSLIGAIPYYQGININEIINYKINHTELETQVGHLFSRSHMGNLIPLKRRYTSGGYDSDSNANLVANTTVKLIQRSISTTFTE